MTRFTVKRLGVQPIVHPGLAQAIGAKINGPSAIRAPGALRLEASGIPAQFSGLNLPERFRNSITSGDLRPHDGSLEVHVDRARQRVVIHCRGLERDCAQITRRAVSKNGLGFIYQQPTGAGFYARVFERQGVGYVAVLVAWLYRSRDSGLSFPGRTGLGDPSARHVAFFPYEDLLFQILSRFGNAPERLLISRVFAAVDRGTGACRTPWNSCVPRCLGRVPGSRSYFRERVRPTDWSVSCGTRSYSSKTTVSGCLSPVQANPV